MQNNSAFLRMKRFIDRSVGAYFFGPLYCSVEPLTSVYAASLGENLHCLGAVSIQFVTLPAYACHFATRVA